MKLGIIDYGGGNRQSVRNALRHTGTEADYVKTAGEFAGLDALVFPGQGAFGDSMSALRRQDLVSPLKDWIAADKPFFGICIGYQVLFDGSEENPGVEGLGIFAGQVVRFESQPDRKVPHMGWNRVNLARPGSLGWDGAESDPFFYFVHSYYPAPTDPALTAGTTEYGQDFVCAIEKGNLIATQFHPEKSQAAGLRLLTNFVRKHRKAEAVTGG